ncbi:MAG: 16S rRNA (cytosine(967)-C(5))-methyltransferase RsmB [Clostridia bacterium]|nr:16S rRNA (cytosine(967)-C(5))-methyltransferase RsmB [Clostridia bacterium]
MTDMSIEREIAVKALLEHHKTGTWPDLYLKNKLEPLNRAQASLATNITYGVLQNLSLIDYYIAHFSSIKISKISLAVLEAMRAAVYQILFLDKIPDSAAVNEAVNYIKKSPNSRASGFANGVLRTIVRQKDSLPEVKGKDEIETLAIRYSHPVWLAKKFVRIFGTEEAEQLMKADNESVKPVIRINTLKTDMEAFIKKAFEVSENSFEPVPGLENALYVSDLAAILKSHLFADGLFYVQDAASQYAVKVLDPKPGDRVLDICAAPGGKSLLAAQMMKNRGMVVSNDVYQHKADIISANAKRYGTDIIEVSCSDSTQRREEFAESFDRIICDVPCSGLGIIRKKPDIRFKDESTIGGLRPIQRKILENAAHYLKPGGQMIYTTCTIVPEENELMLGAFLKEHKDFSLVNFSINGEETDGMITLLPHRHGTDGFFISKLERRPV